MIFAPLTRLFKPSDAVLRANQLYGVAVAQARQPFFYTDYQVADTVDGRFDLIVLHVFLLSRALREIGTDEAQLLRQNMMNRMAEDMDQSLREMGVGDMSVGKKIQKMAYALNGRMETYEKEWEQEALSEAIHRNLYRAAEGTKPQAVQMAAYAKQADALLQSYKLENFMDGSIRWPEQTKQAA